MLKYVLIAFAAFALGIITDALTVGDLMVSRSARDQCVAIDTDTGLAIGEFSKRGGRCHIGDWRWKRWVFGWLP
jgi:hypothetical protein